MSLDARVVERLYRQARAERWGLSSDRFAAALQASVRHAQVGADRAAEARVLAALRVDDLALACACADGHDGAWEHFVREYRPALYRAADAMDPSGGARELADSLYADLFGLQAQDGQRQSLFRYYHGRSSLGTWLRAVLAQRLVDRARASKRSQPLPADEDRLPPATPAASPDKARFLALITAALAWAVAGLAPRDRLRLGCYYAQDLTLAQIGRLLQEHEATVSRHLSRTRRDLRDAVTARLRDHDGLDDAAVSECFAAVTEDAGEFDVGRLLAGPSRKIDAARRSRS